MQDFKGNRPEIEERKHEKNHKRIGFPQMFHYSYAVEGLPRDFKSTMVWAWGWHSPPDSSLAPTSRNHPRPESAPAVLHQPIVLAPLAAIAHH